MVTALLKSTVSSASQPLNVPIPIVWTLHAFALFNDLQSKKAISPIEVTLLRSIVVRFVHPVKAEILIVVGVPVTVSKTWQE